MDLAALACTGLPALVALALVPAALACRGPRPFRFCPRRPGLQGLAAAGLAFGGPRPSVTHFCPHRSGRHTWAIIPGRTLLKLLTVSLVKSDPFGRLSVPSTTNFDGF